MQLNLRLLPVIMLAVFTTFTACRKEATPELNNEAEVKAHTEDQNTVSSELDAVANDANIALESDVYFSGRFQNGQNTNSVCGATAVADTISNTKTITITYNGNNCTGTHLRTGSVILSMAAGVKWRNAGAAITVNVQNLKIKRLTDNKSITINGSQTLTNVNGGLLVTLPSLQNITHTLTSSNMSITFEDNTQRNWQVAHKRLFTYANGVVVTVSGIGVTGGISNATEWGTNRFGRAFTTSITDPLVFRQDCNFRLTSGAVKHEGFATATATFGLNTNGVATTCPGTGSYYYKLTWTGPGGNSVSTILPY